jgi:Cu-Zn family superoxide dismutase
MNTLRRLWALAFALVLLAGLAGCSSSQSSRSAAPPPAAAGPHLTAMIEGRSGSALTGTATFTQASGAVHIVVDVNNAPEGVHAVHLHEKGDCSAPDALSAGGHFNPTHMPHGSPDAPNHHAGDFGNMTVGADGHGHLELDSTILTIAPGEMSVAGHAVVVHAKLDDMTTQPTGNAGGRIGCGVVK